MAHREAGDRYRCEECGSTLVYEAECPCCADAEHTETCCSKAMLKVTS
jgi:transposase-like protein